MKTLRVLSLIAALCTLSLSAFADDFRVTVLDPPTSYPTHIITSTDFDVSFTACRAGELPSGITATGCFAGTNDSGQTWTSLTMQFISNAATEGQTANCTLAASNNIFSSATCGLEGETYTLTFIDGSIPSDDGTASIFFITETGVKPARDFPEGNVAAGVAAAPEPASIALLLTGTAFLGLFYDPRARRSMSR